MNKGYFNIVILLVGALLLFFGTIDARGGGRGGGGGRAAGGGRPVARAPTMSRANIPANRAQSRGNDNRPQMLSGIDSRPTAQQIQSRMQSERGNVKQELQQAAKQSNLGNIDRGSLSNIKQTLPNTLSQRQDTANQIRQRVDQNPNMKDMFTNRFWDSHAYTPPYGYGANWWNRAGWGDLNGWLGYGWGVPYYYDDYGYQIPVSAASGTDYLLSPSDTATPIIPTTAKTAAPTTQNSDWLSLGVFALVNNVKNPSDANMYFQLALGKDGTLSGSYYNKSADKIYPLQGVVDKNSQAAVWKMSIGEGSPIFQTGIYNLTKDQTPVQVSYGDDSKQNWLMIRL